jgi:putative ABC transport system permease protein
MESMFDLESAIKSWKRSLAKSPSLEDSYLAELETVLRDEVVTLARGGMTEEEAFRRASEEMGEPTAIGREFEKARRPDRSLFMPALVWNYIKIFFRKLERQKAYSLITLIGLTAGLAAFILIVLYCQFERSYDDFHQNGDRIFRVQNDRIYSLRHDRSAGCPPGLGPALKQEFPEIADFARLHSLAGAPNIVSRTASSGERAAASSPAVAFYESRVFFADRAFLRIFSFPLIRGDAATALDDPEAAVLSESLARKYFKDENPLGQSLTVTTRFGRHDYRVSGVCRDVPPNSHLKFDLLLSFRRLDVLWPSTREYPWSSNAFLTYLLLSPAADRAALEEKLPDFVEKNSLSPSEMRREFHLQPLRTIHLTSRLRFEAEVNGDLATVRFLEMIGLFILLVAWVNFINLATARSLQRGKEVCVRKTLGAGRRQLAGQFLLESVFLNILGFLLAVTVIVGVHPFFSRLVGKPLAPTDLGGGWIWVGGGILVGALLSGLYPALILSSFKPVLALRGPAQGVLKGTALRKGLVLFQFATAILLIASTLVVGKQLAYMRTQDIGVDLERTLVLRIPQVPGAEQRASVARTQLSGLSSVRDAAVSTSVPSREYVNSASGIRRQAATAEEAQQAFFIDVDERYFPFYCVPFVCGRNFSSGFVGDKDTVIVNEEMVRTLGFESAEKALLQNIVLGGFGGDVVQVVGVVKNYHHLSLRNKIDPVIYLPLPGSYFNSGYLLSLRVDGKSMGPAISSIIEKWKDLFPGQPLEYSFLDDEFNNQYDEDERFGEVFGLSSLLAILIACLGLLGLASFSAERRTREIGIRKVFGASVANIAKMLTGEFLRWVLLANLIAWPLTWIIMSRWLQRFAYRTTPGFWPLALAAVCALAIALGTVSFRAVRSAMANPADSIRHE